MIKDSSAFFASEYLEVTTGIGCSINCRKYCPQEIFIDAYKGEKTLSLENFKKIIETVPQKVIIIFGGFSEPFLNTECTDMILYAFSKGYPIGLFTTFVGLNLEDARRLNNIDFEIIFLHLPDSYGNANIPTTSEYKDVLCHMITTHPNIVYISMNGFFQSNNRENLMRGNVGKRKWYPIHCMKYDSPQFMVLPNGHVHFCCMDMGLKYKIGNLFEQPYTTIRNSVIYPKEICRLCTVSRSLANSYFNKIKGMLNPSMKLKE